MRSGDTLAKITAACQVRGGYQAIFALNRGPRRVPAALMPDITPPLPPPTVHGPRLPVGGRAATPHLGASAAVVDAVNGVLARAHRPQRGAPECGAVHTVLPHAIRSRGSAVPRSRCSAR